MEEMNWPIGEAGLAVYTDSTGRKCWKKWNGYFFTPGRYDAWLAMSAVDRGATQGIAGLRWATLAELTDAGISEDEARKMVHKSMLPEAPWYPPQQKGFGPWVESAKYPDGIAEKHVLLLLDSERKDKRLYTLTAWIYATADTWPASTVAYCLKLEDKPAAVKHAPPATAPDANAAMLDRDAVPPAAKQPQAPTVAAEPDPWHLRCAPLAYRLGLGKLATD